MRFLAGLLAVLLFPMTSASGCADVLVVGARGSGQSGFGPQAGVVVDEVVRSATAAGLRVEVEALEYPAVSITDSFGLALINGEYEASIASGVAALERVFEGVRRCPSETVALIGYSQGAQVVKTALDGLPADVSIGLVVLLADPLRDVEQRGVLMLGGADASRGGAFGAEPYPERVRPLAIDVCATGDGVCERGGGVVAHIDGYDELPDSVPERIRALLGALRSRALRPR